MRLTEIIQEKDNSFQQVIEGYSNYRGLLQIALEKWDKAVAKSWPSGKFTIKIEDPRDSSFEFKIRVEYGLYEVSRAKAWHDKAKVTVNTEESEEEARADFAHEMTHISQKFNNFLKWSDQQFKHLSGLALDQSHREHPTEHEAVLVELGILLAKDQIEKARSRIESRLHYLKMFTFKQLVTKWHSMGVTKEQMQQFFGPLRENIAKNIKTIMIDMKKRGQTWQVGYGLQFFIYEVQLGESLNIYFPKEIEYVRQQITSLQNLNKREQARLDKLLPLLTNL